MTNNALDFLFDNKRLSNYNMIICYYDGSGGIETNDVPPIIFSAVKVVGQDKFYNYGTKYDSPLTTTFSIGKCDGSDISTSEFSNINRWLCRKDGKYRKFKLVQDGYENIYHNVIITTKEIRLNGVLKALEVTATSNLPYALYEPITLNFTLNSVGNYIMHDMSDETGEFPVFMKVTCLSDGDLEIYNNMTNTTSIIKNCQQDETITLDGENEIISSTLPSHSLPDNFNWEFVTIGNKYDDRKNVLEFSLPCEVEITYSPNKKFGM